MIGDRGSSASFGRLIVNRCKAAVLVSRNGDIDQVLADIASFLVSREVPFAGDVCRLQSPMRREGNGGGFYIFAVEPSST